MLESSSPRLFPADPGVNVTSLLTRRLEAGPGTALYEVADGDGWRPVSAGDFAREVEEVARGLVGLGLEPGARFGIMAHTRYEWSLLDWAAWSAGLVPVPLYETSSAEQMLWILQDSAVEVLVVEDAEMAARAAEVRAEAGALREVLVLDGEGPGAMAQILERGRDVPAAEVARRRGLARARDVATIIYTSGTTGRPKGAELTHGNLTDLAVNLVPAMGALVHPGSRTLLFMPMAHVFARFIAVGALHGGAVIAHSPDAKHLLRDLQSFRPTFLLAVPRVFEKVYNSAEQQASTSRLRRRIFHGAVASAIHWSRALDTPSGPGPVLRLRHRVADRLVLSRVRAALGGQVSWAISGGAPLAERLGHFFRAVGVTVLEGYGLTETTAPLAVNRPERPRMGTVGPPVPGTTVRIGPEGEILVRGEGVFARYHNDPQGTAAAFEDGWFRTGDLGSIDEDGCLRITGRSKEIIVTAGGKNVVPSLLEDRVRSYGLVGQAVVVGDGRPFVAALVTLDPEVLPGWLAVHGKPPMTVAQAAADPDVVAAVDEAVARANRAVSRAESIRKTRILDGDLTVENGYLTPSLKIRRPLVLRDFAADIDAIYAGSEGHGF